jgi:hypothetical protein
MNTFGSYVWNHWSWFMHTMSTWFWHKNRVWHHPWCNAAQKTEMRGTTTMKISSRSLRCPRSIACGVGLFCCCSMSVDIVFRVKTISLVIKVYIIKTLGFCIHILVVCMATWSWAYIQWASGFDLKTRCDRGAHGCGEQCNARDTRVYIGSCLREDKNPTSYVCRLYYDCLDRDPLFPSFHRIRG